MIEFGEDDPRKMPGHFYWGALRRDYASAVRADPERQNYSVVPRYWYLDATFRCARCEEEFTFSATEQRAWYEEYGFYVDAFPKHCLSCRREVRDAKELRREYDRDIENVIGGNDLEAKKKLAGTIDTLCEIGGELPPRMNENRRRLGRQISRQESGTAEGLGAP